MLHRTLLLWKSELWIFTYIIQRKWRNGKKWLLSLFLSCFLLLRQKSDHVQWETEVCRLFCLSEEEMGSWLSLKVKTLRIDWIHIYFSQYCCIKKVDSCERELALCLISAKLYWWAFPKCFSYLPTFLLTDIITNHITTNANDKQNFKIISPGWQITAGLLPGPYSR